MVRLKDGTMSGTSVRLRGTSTRMRDTGIRFAVARATLGACTNLGAPATLDGLSKTGAQRPTNLVRSFGGRPGRPQSGRRQ